jgi:hypothetical protein
MLLSVFFIGGGLTSAMAQSDIKEISEESIEYSQLPKAVQDGFKDSEYANWEIEEIEKVKTDKGTMYELKVENEEDETYYELYFSPNGKLVYKEKEGEGHGHSKEEENH